MKSRVGLEALAFEIPDRFLSLVELAHARGLDPNKFTQGLGQLEMAIAVPSEDTVALAAGAGLRALAGVDRDAIGLLIVGTETSVDQSKPVSSYVHEHLGISPQCRVFETKHACYGATAGVQIAIDWILSGRAEGKKALVIASDIARYGAHTPGEPTQGAGAVAMVISDQPKLLSFETRRQGFHSEQVMDFWRPAYSKEAFADGHYSIECYLRALRASFVMYAKNETEMFKQFAACLYHAPFAKMMQKAHLALWNAEPKSDVFAEAMKDFDTRVKPYLELNARVGNIYTGSLWLSLIPLLESGAAEGRDISLFSYGSGCMAEFMTARVQPGASRLTEPFRPRLDARTRIGVEEYEAILEACGAADTEGARANERWGSKKQILFTGVQAHRRGYERAYSK